MRTSSIEWSLATVSSASYVTRPTSSSHAKRLFFTPAPSALRPPVATSCACPSCTSIPPPLAGRGAKLRNSAVGRAWRAPRRFQWRNPVARMEMCPRLLSSAAHLLSGRSRWADGRFMDWRPPSPTSRFATCGKQWITRSLFLAPRFWPASFCMPLSFPLGAVYAVSDCSVYLRRHLVHPGISMHRRIGSHRAPPG